ncbi:MAG: histidine phosphatase family protein, partial [Janthinobacterium lividum]
MTTTIFYADVDADVDDFATLTEVYARHTPDPPPAGPAPADVRLPRGLLVSLDAVAVLPPTRCPHEAEHRAVRSGPASLCRVTTVLLIRHGRTSANTAGVLAGRSSGVELDELGRQQVSALGGRIAGVPLVALVSSPLRRCRQ